MTTSLTRVSPDRGLSVTETGATRKGRPTGSLNKKTMSRRAIGGLKDKIGMFLPPEDFDYMVAILDGTEEPELKRDLDIFLTLQLKALLPILSEEIQTGKLTREGTQRSSTVKELLALRFQMEKHDKGDEGNDQRTFIQQVFNLRGMDAIAVSGLIGSTSLVPLGGPADASEALPQRLPEYVDDDEGQPYYPRTVSD